MYTLGQWRNVRRVDHARFIGVSFSRGVYIARPRWRGFDANNRPNLKAFDPFVQAYHQANNRFDRISALAEIISLAYHFIQNRQEPDQVNDRYNNAIRAIRNQAIVAMNGIVGAQYQQSMEHYITGVHRPARTVRLNCMLMKVDANQVIANGHNTINNQIGIANAMASYQAAQLTLNRVGNITEIWEDHNNDSFLLTAAMGAPVNMQGKFQDSAGGGRRLIDYCNGLNTVRDVDIVYLASFDQNDVQGRTLRAGNDYNGHVPVLPIITVRLTPANGGDATHPTTLAHEMGHALCSEPLHSAAAAELMTNGGNRNGNNVLTLGQQAWFCNSAFVN